jgi:hypothetical protein
MSSESGVCFGALLCPSAVERVAVPQHGINFSHGRFIELVELEEPDVKELRGCGSIRFDICLSNNPAVLDILFA